MTDKDFFAKNPHLEYRLRPYLPGEVGGPDGDEIARGIALSSKTPMLIVQAHPIDGVIPAAFVLVPRKYAIRTLTQRDLEALTYGHLAPELLQRGAGR